MKDTAPACTAVLRALCTSIAAASCGGDNGTPNDVDASRSAEAGGESGQDGDRRGGDDVWSDALAADARAEAEAADGGAEGDSACPSGLTPPPVVASVGTISFVVTNDGAADCYVVTQGQACDPFAIAGEQLSVPFQCTCECAVPRTSFTLMTLAPGQSLTLTWDGRHVVPYMTYFDCRAYGYSQGCQSVANGSAEPVPAGAHTVSIAYATQAPGGGPSQGCTAVTGGFQCTSVTASGLNTQCGSGVGGSPPMQLATQDFTLSPSGNATIPVSIP